MIEALHAMAYSEDTTIKTFEFKLRINKAFVETCERELEHSRQIYNAALAERISCYRTTGASLSYKEQSRHLTEARALMEVDHEDSSKRARSETPTASRRQLP